ncbi:MAG: oxalate:formate antiporter [Syntrophus sp. (in: bacteria)]|nr:oxalate:formate antiporter [Syntrophus sp. (in: bacteria)]
MTDMAVKNKGWTVTFAGMGVNLALGVLYSWSVIKKAIPPEWGWDDADKALPYSIACITFAIMTVPAGRLQDRIGPRWVSTAGGVLTGIGCIIASFATSVLWYVIGFGLLTGAGIGLGYAAATPPAVKWFSAKKTGLIAGIVVAGFGLASVYISPLANYFTGYNLSGKPLPVMEQMITMRTTAEDALKESQVTLNAAKSDPAKFAEALMLERTVAEKKAAAKVAAGQFLNLQEANIQKTLLIFGVGFLILVTLLSQFLTPPPVGYKPPEADSTNAGTNAAVNIGPGEMLKTPLFYLLWIMLTFGAGAGLMIISMVTTIAKIGQIEAGFILVALLAIGNASGRILAGMLSDTIGRLWTMFIIFIFQAALMMVLRTGLSDMTAFIIVSMLIGFNYGACLSVFPSATKDNFGLKNFGVNYGLVFTSWGVGGLLFPFVAGKMFEAAKKATGAGSYDNAYLMAAALLVVAGILTFVTRGIEQKHKRKFSV